jgi:hypothetical protein
MKLTVGHVYHAFEFVKYSLKKIAPINYSQKMGGTGLISMPTFLIHHRSWFLCRRCVEVRQHVLPRRPQRALGRMRYTA